MPEAGIYLIEVPVASSGLRLDVLISNHIPNCSRAFSAKQIQAGNVFRTGIDILQSLSLFQHADGCSFYYLETEPEIFFDGLNEDFLNKNLCKKPGLKIKTGEWICVYIPVPESVSIEPESIDLNVLYDDEHLAVINKDAGMVVHPAPGHYSGTLVNALMYRFPDISGIGGELRPGIVHRLDKDTSGIIIIAKNDFVHQKLSKMFKKREIQKTYLALVYDIPKNKTGIIDYPIGRHPRDRKKMSVKAVRPKDALTIYTIKETYSKTALVEVNIKTGRTHQIRVHLSAINHPIIGDNVYGNKKSIAAESNALRQMLHAERIRFTHPVLEIPLYLTAPIPEDMSLIIRKHRYISAQIHS